MNNLNGIDKARAVANKLKEENAQEQEKAIAAKDAALSQLATLQGNSELAQMYADNAQVGAENLAGELPLLKVHATGRSSSNELADGSEPKDGAFFYKPTKEEFDTVTCHILTISAGFRAEGLKQKDGSSKQVFNQIVGGVIVDGTEYKPFIMYFTGLKLSKLWEFGKEINKYTHMRPVGIPMFALTVTLSTEKVKNDFGSSWIINFDVVKDTNSQPQLVLDPGEFTYLRDSVETVSDTIASLITTKTTLKDESYSSVHDVVGDVPLAAYE